MTPQSPNTEIKAELYKQLTGLNRNWELTTHQSNNDQPETIKLSHIEYRKHLAVYARQHDDGTYTVTAEHNMPAPAEQEHSIITTGVSLSEALTTTAKTGNTLVKRQTPTRFHYATHRITGLFTKY